MWDDNAGDTRDAVLGAVANHPPTDISGVGFDWPDPGADAVAQVVLTVSDYFPGSPFVATWRLDPDPRDDNHFKVTLHDSGSMSWPISSFQEYRHGTYQSVDCEHVAAADDQNDLVGVLFDPACLPDTPLHVQAETSNYTGSGSYVDHAPDATWVSNSFGLSEPTDQGWFGPIGRGAGCGGLCPSPRPTPSARDVKDTCDSHQSATFSDIGGNPHEYSIRCVATYGIAQGKGDGRFAPGGTLSRGQTATFLLRTLTAGGASLPTEAADYCQGSAGIHENSVELLIEAKIVASTACDAAVAITRGEMATWVVTSLDRSGVPPPSGTTDWYWDDEDNTHEPRINVLTSHGVVTGKGGGAFGPTESLSRAQMATFLARTLDVLKS